MPPKTVALIGAVCLTTGWLLASLLMPPVAKVQTLRERRAPTAAAEADLTASFSEQLHLRLQQTPQAPTTRRNPFAFGTRRTSADPLVRSSLTPPPPPDETPAPAPIGPIYSLAGLGVGTTPEGSVRTAIITDGTTVHLVKAGDTIGAYTVREITETTVFLVDATGGQTTLRLTQ